MGDCLLQPGIGAPDLVTFGNHTCLLKTVTGWSGPTANKLKAFDHLLDGISPKGWELPWPRHGSLGRLDDRLGVTCLDASGQLGPLLLGDEIRCVQSSELLFWGALGCSFDSLSGRNLPFLFPTAWSIL